MASATAERKAPESTAPSPDGPALPLPPIATSPHGLAATMYHALVDPLRLWDRRHYEEAFVVSDTPLGRQIVVSDPEAIRRVLIDESDRYGRDLLSARVLRRVTGRSVFSAEGEDWRRQRRLLSPFFTPRAVEARHDVMAAAAEDAVARLAAEAGSSVDMAAWSAAATVDVLTHSYLPFGTGETSDAIARSVRRFADLQGRIGLLDLFGLPSAIPDPRRLLAPWIGRGVRLRASRILARSFAAGGTSDHDLAAALLAAGDRPPEERFSPREISDTLSMLLGAGTDTVAQALTWSLHLLATHPCERDAVEAEVDAVTGGGGVTSEKLPELRRTRAVVDEAMRLYPPAPSLGRRALADDRLGDVAVPKGSMIVIAPLVLHRHRRLWAEPDRFVPERFLGERREAVPRMGYLPFGAGPRVCLGSAFAQREAVLLLATLLRDLRFRPEPGREPTLRQRITLQPAGGLKLTVERRR